MKISIITPTYNGERFLRETIESVLAQVFTDWEYLIVDDGSIDQSIEIAKEYASKDKRIRLLTKPNGGVASARNFGFEHSSHDSDYLIFLDQDDIWHTELLQKLLGAVSTNPKAVGAHCLCRIADSKGNPVQH